MIPILLSLLVGAFAPDKAITSLAVQPSSGDRTEVVVRLDGDVTWKHFSLRNPERVVIDIAGAKQGLALEFSDIKRGGVTGMRVSQYTPLVVRVVIDLSQNVKYETREVDGEIRISFPNPNGEFETWETGLTSRRVKVDVAKKTEPAATKAAEPVQQRQQPRVTVSFQDEPIMTVLLTFSEFSGRSIVASPEVKSITVSADVRDQPWDVALEAILSAHGLAAREMESGIIVVEQLTKVAERMRAEPQVTQIFYMKYASGGPRLQTMRPLLSDRG